MNSAAGQAAIGTATTFLVFSDDWGHHPSSCQHIFRHIAGKHRVAWINTIGMRNPSLRPGDLRKALRKVKRMIARGQRPGAAAVSEAPLLLETYQPFMLPGVQSTAVRTFNARSVGRTIKSALRQIGDRRPVVVSTVPNAADYEKLFEDWAVIYYCVDDFSVWEGHNASLIRQMEERLIERSSALIATSQSQCDRLSATGKPTHLLTHGVDVELFVSSAAEHACLNRIPRPRVGFFGLIDQRFDQSLVESVARVMPEVSFVLAGPVEVNVRILEDLQNVFFTGRVRYVELPALISGLDVLILPYGTGELGDTLSPLKLKECLATGKPIVSAPIAAAIGTEDFVTIAHTPADWQTAILKSLTVNVAERRRAILPTIREESWESKAARLTEIAESLMSAKSG